MSKGKILVVEDDIHIGQLIQLYLTKEGYNVVSAQDGIRGLEIFKEEMPNLVLLDIMLPKMDGWDLCRTMKKISDVPMIMVTAKGDTFDRVLGLKMGADDYIIKPFDPRELVARVEAVLRRYRHPMTGRQIVLPHLLIDMEDYKVKIMDETVELPPKEMTLLYFLVKNQNQVFTREQLIEHIWGFDFDGDYRTIDVHIKRLREKLDKIKDHYAIKTVWGVGYKFEVISHAKYSL